MRSRDALPVIAVGGGLAGAAFALELARNGRSVILLERTRGPHHKVCGEFLSAEAQTALASVGLDVQALGASAIARFRLVTGERHATAPLPFAGVGISRLHLDEALLSAAERAGATIVRDTTVAGIEPRAEAVTVRSENRMWEGAAAGLATGKHSLRGILRPLGHMVGFKLHLETTGAARALDGIVQLVFFRGGYVGACLVEDSILSVAWVMHEALVRAVGAHWTAQKEHLARQSSFIGDLLSGARPLLAKPVAVAAIPYGYLRVKPIAPNVFPLGDQAAVVPSFTGDGMAIALYSGVGAARALLAGLPPETYQRNLVTLLKPKFRLAGGIGRVLETPITCAMSVSIARFFPSLVTGFAAATRLSEFEDGRSWFLPRTATSKIKDNEIG